MAPDITVAKVNGQWSVTWRASQRSFETRDSAVAYAEDLASNWPTLCHLAIEVES